MRRFLPAAIFLALFATVALAATLAEVTAAANGLLVTYEDLEERVDACPNGECTGAQDILDDLAVAEGKLVGLHADRATLDPCTTCASVDATIDDIDDLSVLLASSTAEWEEQG